VFNRGSAWIQAVATIGLPGLHFHDPRHTGKHLAARAAPGSGTCWTGWGHDRERAAIIYQYEAQGADKVITDAIDTHVLAKQARRGDDDGADDVLVPAG
jgi:hypothetical protein